MSEITREMIEAALQRIYEEDLLPHKHILIPRADDGPTLCLECGCPFEKANGKYRAVKG